MQSESWSPEITPASYRSSRGGPDQAFFGAGAAPRNLLCYRLGAAFRKRIDCLSIGETWFHGRILQHSDGCGELRISQPVIIRAMLALAVSAAYVLGWLAMTLTWDSNSRR
jgi:hypothetical protein